MIASAVLPHGVWYLGLDSDVIVWAFLIGLGVAWSFRLAVRALRAVLAAVEVTAPPAGFETVDRDR